MVASCERVRQMCARVRECIGTAVRSQEDQSKVVRCAGAQKSRRRRELVGILLKRRKTFAGMSSYIVASDFDNLSLETNVLSSSYAA